MTDKMSLALKFVLGFTFSGFLFSGYISAYKLISGTCAFREPCPLFLGQPACWFGFAIFLALFAFAFLMYQKRLSLNAGFPAVAVFAFLGILFAGYLSMLELPSLIKNGFAAYTLGVPTCFLGLLFYMLTFLSAMLGWAHNRE